MTDYAVPFYCNRCEARHRTDQGCRPAATFCMRVACAEALQAKDDDIKLLRAALHIVESENRETDALTTFCAEVVEMALGGRGSYAAKCALAGAADLGASPEGTPP